MISFIGLAVSGTLFVCGVFLLFWFLPMAAMATAVDKDSDIDPDFMLALLPVSISLMFIGGVGISAFG